MSGYTALGIHIIHYNPITVTTMLPYVNQLCMRLRLASRVSPALHVMSSLFAQCPEQRCHLDRRRRRLKAFVPGLGTGPLDGLFDILGRKHPKNARHAGF